MSAASSLETTAAPAPKTHPLAFWFFFWGEFAERCSYYGMRILLPVYLSEGLLLKDSQTDPIYFTFKMAVYLTPLVGGFIADRFLGRYWTIVGFSIPYVLGHFILGIPTLPMLFIALALLACGSGVIKPNISTLLGLTYDEKRPGQERLRSAALMWFYFAVNVGALVSTYWLPELLAQEGYAKNAPQEVNLPAFAFAFQVPAWLMVGALAIFALGKPFYAKEKNREVHTLTPVERAQRRATLRQLFGIFGVIVFFYVAYEHNDSVWRVFIRDYVDLHVPWKPEAPPPAVKAAADAEQEPADANSFQPGQLQVLNPLFVLVFVPLFNGLFKYFDPRQRIFDSRTKILMGFLFTALAVGIMAAAGFQASADGPKLALAWPVTAYIILTIGEVLIYGTGLDLSYSLAPKGMKSLVTACFLFTIALGNFINAGLTQLYGGSLRDKPADRGPMSPGEFFGMTTLILLAAAVAFWFVTRNLRAHSEAQPVTA